MNQSTYTLGHRILALLCALALAVGLMPTAALAEATVTANTDVTITVTEADDNSTAISGAEVKFVCGENESDVPPIPTGTDGKVTFHPTTQVTLKTVEVSKEGYASKTVDYNGEDLSVVLVKLITGITDVSNTVSLIKNGTEEQRTKTLTPTVVPGDQTEGITWSSASEAVATVDENGKVTAVGKGSTKITAEAKEQPNIKQEYSVTVQVVPEGVTLDKTTLNLQPSNETTLQAMIDPSDADTQKAITWESNVPTVATVDQTGKVTAVANGTATITATTENGKTATCTVKVTTAATAVTIENKPEGNKITYGASHTFSATLTPNTATDTVVWSIENGQDCVTLDASTPGKVTATKVGTVTIKATAGNASDTYQFTVAQKEIKVTGLTLGNKEYDGKATVSTELLTAARFDGLVGKDSVNLSGVTFNNTSAATASDTPYSIAVNYDSASVNNPNYTLDISNSVDIANLTITKKPLKVSALTDANGNAPTYTAGTSYDGLKLTLTGIVEADSTLSGTFTGVQATSTTKINVMEGGAEVSLVYPAGSTSAYDTNYTLPLEAKLVLTKKPLTATVTGAEKEFDGTTVPKDTNGNAVQFAAALDGIIGEDKVTPVVTNSAYLDVNASDSVNVKADVALDGDDAQNYILQPEITFVPGKITKSNNINLTVEFEPSVQDPENTMDVIVRAVGGYDGALLSGTAVATYDTATATGNTKNIQIENGEGKCIIDALPGEQTVSVSFAVAEPTRNYTGTKVAAAKYNENYKVQELSGAAITEVTYGTPASLGVYAVEKGTNTRTNAAIQYTSNNTAAATIDENTGKITVVNVDAATDHKVTFTAKAQRIEDQERSSYYNASYSKTYEVKLVKQSVTPSITCSGKTYDGTTVASVTGSLAGVVRGDSVILSNNGTDGNLTAAYDSAAAGGHTVTANGLTLLGTTPGDVPASNNYTLTATTVTCTATISPKSIADSDFTIALDGDGTMYYTGGNREPVPTVKVDLNGDGTRETTLVSGTDYTVSYENQKEIGENTAKVTVTAKGNYSGVRNQNYSISYKPVDPNAEMIKVNGNHAGAVDTQRTYPKDSNNKIWWYNSNVMLTPADGYTLDDEKPTQNVALQGSKTYSDEGLNIFSGKKFYIKETATGFISELEIGDAINIDKTAPRLTAVSTTEGIRYGDADYYNQTFTTTFVVNEANYGANTGNSSFAVSAGTEVTVYDNEARVATVTSETSNPTAITVTVDPGESVIAGEYHKPYVTITDPAGNKLVVADGVAASCSDGKAVDNILKTLDTKAPEVVLSYAFADGTPLEATHYYDNNAYYKDSFAASYTYSDENGIDRNKVFKTAAVSEGSGFGVVETNPSADLDKIEIPASVDNNGHYQFGAYGVDKAGNALTVKEKNTSGSAAQTAVYTGKNADNKFVSDYHKVLDTVNPVATITVNAGNSLRKELQTNYNNRYYFNDSFATTISVEETNYDAAKVTARVGSVNSSTVEQNGNTLQTQEVSATSVLTTQEAASPYMYSQQVTADGVYCFDLKGVDRAGNQIILNGGNRAANFVQSTLSDTSAVSGEAADRYVTYVFAEDKTAPVLNVTMKDANNKNNGFNQQTGNFYEATLTSVGYQLSTNYPYRSSKVADFAFTTKDNSPVTVLYKVDSTAANSNFAYERNGAAGMIGQAGAAGAEAYADGLTYTQQTADKEQILQINSLLIEDLAGNQVSYSKTENENKIYLDVSAPTDDQLQPVVRLSYPSPVTQNTMSHRDISGVNLYKDTVVVTADVMDPYTNASQEARGSGLYRVYYKVIVNGESQTGKVGIQTGSGKSAVAADDGVYYIDYNTTGQSGPVNGGNETLTASDKLTFTFNPNDGVFNYNSIVLTVWAVDNANNEIADANKAIYKFGIDVTAPIIEISYDNNDADNEKYFKADRTATVVVTERNFDESKIDIVTESNSISGWSYSAGAAANGDEDKWTCTISYNVDGVYTLNISGADQLGINAASVTYDGVAPQSFVIDKTAPVVDVAFDNNDVRNGKYYNQSRTATVSVTDVNFNGVNAIDVSAAVGGTAPAVSFNGLTATLPFTTDGTYSFRGTVTDMAGNVSQEFTVDEFVIDQTAPELSIEGVEDLVAYPGEVLPRIVFSDQNYEGNTIQLLRTVLDQKNVDVSELIVPNGGVTAGADGLGTGSISYEDLEHVQENDGIYTLTASVTDLAGNSTEDEVTYSVNRFGSVYVYSDALTNMIGAYKQKADEGLYISAYNVSPLIEDSTKLQISCDGASLSNQNSKAVVTGGAQAGNSGWYEYRFDISGSDLTGDGRYEITLSDKDEAGNTKTNAENPIWFYIDTTKPSLDSVIGLENSIVNADSQTVSFMASDAIALSSIQVYIDNEQIQQATDFETTAYESEFQVGTGLRHRIRFVITDKAGNVLDTDEDSFVPSYTFNKVMTVSTNFFVRWFANTPLFVGSIAVGACGIGTVAFVFIRKRRRMTVSEDD